MAKLNPEESQQTSYLLRMPTSQSVFPSGPRNNRKNCNPRANGAKRRSGRKPGARVTNFVLAELKVVARDR